LRDHGHSRCERHAQRKRRNKSKTTHGETPEVRRTLLAGVAAARAARQVTGVSAHTGLNAERTRRGSPRIIRTQADCVGHKEFELQGTRLAILDAAL
jgi:hypothetical protein